jgi:hypothetical protein
MMKLEGDKAEEEEEEEETEDEYTGRRPSQFKDAHWAVQRFESRQMHSHCIPAKLMRYGESLTVIQ